MAYERLRTTPISMRSLAQWEKREHGKCLISGHRHYRVRLAGWVEVRCKLCKYLATETYEQSWLKPPRREEEAA